MSGTQQNGLSAGAVDDGGFDAHVAVATVQNQQIGAQFRLHVRGAGGAHTAKAVGAGCRDTQHAQWQTRLQQSLGHRMRGATQTDRVLTTRRSRGHTALARQDQGEWAGPKSGHQGLCKVGPLRRKMRHLLLAGHMHDERVVGRAALGHKDFRDRRVVRGIGRQAVNGLGGQADQLAVAQSLCSLRDGRFVGTEDHAQPQKASMPSKAAACKAVARTASGEGPVIFK